MKKQNKKSTDLAQVQVERIISSIDSRWEVEKGKWDNKNNQFIDRKTELFDRKIKMEIIEKPSGLVLNFIGGPTGWESYYVEDLIGSLTGGGELCICGGTINRWPACFVSAATVKDFIARVPNLKGLTL